MNRSTSPTLPRTPRPPQAREHCANAGRYPLEGVVLLVVALMVCGSAVSVALTLGSATLQDAPTPLAARGVTAAASSLVTVETTGPDGRRSAGTGIVLTADGRVLTNHHVVAGATALRASTADGATYAATVVGYDSTADVAVLQLVGATGLTVALLGHSHDLVVGNRVSVVGNADGHGRMTVAPGQVTALRRSVTTTGPTGATSGLGDLIQVDARTAPGVSGGALVGPDGTVVGMASAGESGVDGGDPTGFAIPIDDALASVTRILAGEVSAGVHLGPSASLGVQPAPGGALLVTTPTGTTVGVLVDATTPGSPAAAAGLGPGDVLTAVGAVAVPSQAALAVTLSAHRPGDAVSLAWTDALGYAHRGVVTLAAGPVG